MGAWELRLKTSNEPRDSETRIRYFNNVLMAEPRVECEQCARRAELLDQCIPQPGHADLRGWEWSYLTRQCHVPLVTFAAPRPETMGVALSRDGKLLAASARSGVVRVWDLASGRTLHDFEVGGEAVSVKFRPDGTQLIAAGQLGAAGGGNEVVRVWDLRTGHVEHDFRGHTSFVNDVCFSSDGRSIASAGDDGTVRLWDADTARPLQVLRGPCTVYAGVVFSPDGRRVFGSGGTLHLDSTPAPPYEITVWDARSGSRLQGLGQDSIFCGLGLSGDGARVAVGSHQGPVWLWDLKNDPDGRNPRILRGHTAMTNRVSFSPDGTRLASASDDGAIKVWNAASGEELFTLRGHHAAVQNVAFHTSGNQIVSVSSDGTARLWDARSDPQSRPMTGHSGAVRGLAYARDGGRLASVSADKTLRFWDPSTGRAIGAPVGLSEKPWSLAYSPDGRQLAIASGDWSRAETRGIVEIRDSGDGHLLHRMEGHNRIAWGVAYHPRGAWLASSGGEDHLPGDILLWDSATGRRLRSFPEVPEGLVSLAFDPEGDLLAAGSMSGTIRLWDAKGGQLVWARQAHDGRASCLRFSASGAELLSAGEDGRVKLLEPARRRRAPERAPASPMHAVGCAIYSPDGRRLATCSSDGRIQIWDAATGEVVLSLRHSGFGGVARLAFSSDGRELASGGNDGVIRLWDARPLMDSGSGRR